MTLNSPTPDQTSISRLKDKYDIDIEEPTDKAASGDESPKATSPVAEE